MFCENCGNQIKSVWKFCKYCGYAVKKQPVNSASNDGELNIFQMEYAIKKASPNDPHMADMLMIIGDAYFRGLNHAPVDKKKAMEYFEKAADLGNAYSHFQLGGYYLWDDDSKNDFDGDTSLNFGMGIMHLSKAHLAGFQSATDMLNDMINEGMITGASCIDDVLDIGGRENLV